MAKSFSIELEKLTCFKESDASGHSEPYLWSTLLVINDTTLKSSTPVARHIKNPEYAQVVLKKDMQKFDMVDIPSTIGVFAERYEDQMDVEYFIFVSVLWEKDETPKKAVEAGYLAFCRSIQTGIADNLAALYAGGTDILNSIKEKVNTDVRNAIADNLSTTQKINYKTGVLNLDDLVGVDYKIFKKPNLTSGLVTFLTFQSEDQKNLYLLTGKVRVVTV